jgi:death-on-curing protein
MPERKTDGMVVWILNRVALALHRRQLAEHGGAPGFDLVRLSMALGWPKTVAILAEGRASANDLAAAYADGILRLRPFQSGNERTAYLLAHLFLALNGAQLPATRPERLAVFTALAGGALTRAQYAQWMAMRQFADRSKAASVVGVRRDNKGRVVGVGVWRSGVKPGAGRSLPRATEAPPVPMLEN